MCKPMEKHELNGVMILEESVEVIIESLGDDFSWSGFTACDCGASPVDCCMPAGEDDRGSK